MRFIIIALSAALLFSSISVAANHGARIGDQIANLNFKDIHYLPRSLDDFQKKKAIVLVFTTTTCPLAQRYLPTLRQLDRDYRGKAVQCVAINVGAADSILAIAAHAVRHDMDFPFVKDQSGDCVRAVGVRRTPEVVVLDDQRRLCYRGRIDDQYRLGGVRPAATSHDLKEAIDAVLAGRKVTRPETVVDGCPITFAKPRKPRDTTYAEHVAPIL